MRGYITGSTGTSLWTNYAKGAWGVGSSISCVCMYAWHVCVGSRRHGVRACACGWRSRRTPIHAIDPGRLIKMFIPPTGVRQYCGHDLPDGLVKNQKLAANLLTPTTKVIGQWTGLVTCVCMCDHQGD